MAELVVQGPARWAGELRVEGAKNACLPILAASLLLDDQVNLVNIPELQDIASMGELLATLGKRVSHSGREMSISPTDGMSHIAPYEVVKKMRASILVLGPLLAKLGRVEVALPGGCSIGARPVDQHLQFMKALGAEVDIEAGHVRASQCGGLKGCEFTFDVISVTGTENALTAAVLAKGKTVIHQIAIEPEVICLVNFLNACGAKIQIVGTSAYIEGVASLHAPDKAFRVIGDRIEAGTYLVGAMMSQGQITLRGIDPCSLEQVLTKMREAGAEIHVDKSQELISLKMSQRPKAVSITTAVYPGFPTDLQAQWAALAAVSEGSCEIKETIFENRLMHASELKRMGADIQIHGNVLCVNGVQDLQAVPVMATDLRASACLVLAACCAQGDTVIGDIYHIDRGYARIEDKLQPVGVNILRKVAEGACN